MLIENIDHHRSRERIRDLGEVFTQEKYVEEMLDMVAEGRRSVWSDENISFFEPCAGHGNFVVAILRRRMEAMFKKARSNGTDDPGLFAVANAMNTLWAIDIDTANVDSCRARVFGEICAFLAEKLETNDIRTLISKTGDFVTHVLCAIRWQIRENEALSALTQEKTAASQRAALTKMGSSWFEENGHRYLNFQETWVTYFAACKRSRSIPIEFEKAERFVRGVESGKAPSIREYLFAKVGIKLMKPEAGILDEKAAG